MSEKCRNCKIPLEDSLLSYCSNKCLFEAYLSIYLDCQDELRVFPISQNLSET
jgi:hypothetical protein